ncbi:MAG: hypothetical protein JWN76_2194 [Chitinophagaceae bacterium]|nr:hypothetical protein [Chitinophagaceae bacterium]
MDERIATQERPHEKLQLVFNFFYVSMFLCGKTIKNPATKMQRDHYKELC